MASRIVVSGVGMIPFRQPGASPSYAVMAAQAARLALADARAGYESIQQAFASYVHADSAAGQRVLYDLGMTGIPIVNVRNGGAGGATALYLARQAIASGEADIVLALGFEQFAPVPTTSDGSEPLAPDLRLFGAAGLEHMKRYGTPLETFAKIRAKASRHAAGNPLALLRQAVTVEAALADVPLLVGVMTRAMASPPACGAAAAVLCSEDYARRHGLDARVWIAAQAMASRGAPSSPDGADPLEAAGCGMSRTAAFQVYEQAGIGAGDLDLVELHDGCAHSELLSCESLDLCADGEARQFVDAGDNTYGGRLVVNPSGGLLGQGCATGATGLAQCFELVQQLRGDARQRQVDHARVALQHTLDAGGTAVVTMYRR